MTSRSTLGSADKRVIEPDILRRLGVENLGRHMTLRTRVQWIRIVVRLDPSLAVEAEAIGSAS